MKELFKKRKTRDIAQLIIGFLIILVLNIGSGFKFKRFDLTAEKRYSLSDSTKKLMRNLDDKMLVTVYLEDKDNDLNVQFKRLRNATREILDEFKFYAGSNFQYRFVDPFAEVGKDEELKKNIYDQLKEKGLEPTDIFEKINGGQKVKQIFPGAIVSYGNAEVPVQLLESQFRQDPIFVLNQSIERLEYNFSKAFYKLFHFQKKKHVVFTRGHGEMFELNLADMVTELRDFYEVNAVNIKNDVNVLSRENIDCLIIAKPDSMFDDASKFIIDQYIMNGGKVLWLLDNVIASMDSIGSKNYTVGVPNDIGLYDQLFKYGVRINPTIIQDNECGRIKVDYGQFGTQAAETFAPWYYYPVITPDGKHPIVKNINSVRLQFANSMDTIKTPGIKKTVLLHTSNLTKVQYAPVRISLNVVEQKPTKENFSKDSIPVAVLLEGEFKSVFADRIVELGTQKALTKSKPTQMIVVSDGDIIKNEFTFTENGGFSAAPLGLDTKSGIYYGGNKTFLLNAVNYLTGDSWLVPLRSKDYRVRMLDGTKLNRKLKIGGAKLTNRDLLKVINLIVPVLMIILFGLIYNTIRKRRFA
jgi:ABC-2 type transport system permease protein